MKLKRIVKNSLCVLSLVAMMTSSVLAANTNANDEKKVLDLEYAISLARGKDDTLAKYTRNIEVYKEQKTCLSDLADGTYKMKAIDLEEAEHNKFYRIDVITKQVTDEYQNIILLQKNITLLKEQIKIGEKQVKQAEIKKTKGYCDELTYEKILQNLDNAKMKKEQAEKNLEDAKKSFLQLTNINIDRYTLVADDSYEVFNLDKSVNAYATGMASELIKYNDKRVKVNEDNFWDFLSRAGEGATGPSYATYLEQKANLESSKENVKNAYDNYVLLIQTKCTALSAQLDAIKTSKADYDAAVKDMKALEIKYKAGYVSTMDYEAKKVDLQSKQVIYLSEVYRYNSLKTQVEKPWTMSEYAF